MADEELTPAAFGSAFKGFLEQSVAHAPKPESEFARLLRDHFGTEPNGLPVVAQSFELADRPNVQRALDACTEGLDVQAVGVSASHKGFAQLGFGELLLSGGGAPFGGMAVQPGPVEYVDVVLGPGEVVNCIEYGLLLVGTEPPVAVFVASGRNNGPFSGLSVSVMAGTREEAEAFLAAMRKEMRERNVYRSRVLKLSQQQFGPLEIRFHELPQIARDDIVLPAGVLDRVETHTIGFARNADRLLAAGRHLKRGLLLHGPPGTGKTLSAMYLASAMKGRTTLLLAGFSVGLLARACELARLLAPSLVVLEDVDLIAEERTSPGQGCAPFLFELLNQMDGLAEDVDVVFLLTTNRPDLLEPALASRPGRIDQAVEIPLPDLECRRRLVDLYGDGLRIEAGNLDDIVRRTEGVSAAFVRELLRKAAVYSADESPNGIVVRDAHLEDALRELLVAGGDLTKSLLGARSAP